MQVLVDIPALNEAESVGDVIPQLPRELDGVTSLRLLVVDDGSTDRTPPLNGLTGARLRNASYSAARLRLRSTEHATRLLTAWGMPA